MLEFHGGKKSVWTAITKRTGKRKPITAAIAYLSKADALPFKGGDRLVINLSIQSVSTGATNPKVARALLRHGVELRSHPNLHAKVILMGERLFVGSMNLSTNSAEKLVEAAVETTNKLAHSDAGAWLEELCEETPLVTMAEIKRLIPYYRPPRGGTKDKSVKAPETGSRTRKPNTWLIGSVPDDEVTEEVDAILEEGPKDKQFAGYDCYYLRFPASWRNPVQERDFIIEVSEEDRRLDVWPAAMVWKIKVIKKRRYIFIAHPRSDEKDTMTWGKFRQFADRRGLTNLSADRDRIIPAAAAARIIEEWTPRTTNSKR